MSPRLILSAYHCAVHHSSLTTLACDHSDGKRLAVLGLHEFFQQNIQQYNTIPIIKVLFPPKAWLRESDHESHDLALFVLATPVKYTSKVGPICLPEPDAEYGGLKAVAAGWGKTGPNKEQSNVLKSVELEVSTKKYKHKKMFGTKLSKEDDQYKDPCSGDSGDFKTISGVYKCDSILELNKHVYTSGMCLYSQQLF